jgi:hypothetical protein
MRAHAGAARYHARHIGHSAMCPIGHSAMCPRCRCCTVPRAGRRIGHTALHRARSVSLGALRPLSHHGYSTTPQVQYIICVYMYVCPYALTYIRTLSSAPVHHHTQPCAACPLQHARRHSTPRRVCLCVCARACVCMCVRVRRVKCRHAAVLRSVAVASFATVWRPGLAPLRRAVSRYLSVRAQHLGTSVYERSISVPQCTSAASRYLQHCPLAPGSDAAWAATRRLSCWRRLSCP